MPVLLGEPPLRVLTLCVSEGNRPEALVEERPVSLIVNTDQEAPRVLSCEGDLLRADGAVREDG